MNRTLADAIGRGRKAIGLARRKGMDTSEWESRLKELFEEAGREPSCEEGLEPWMLWEWRRASIPEWQRILQESTDKGDRKREEYARWMLREMLLDPGYEEPIS